MTLRPTRPALMLAALCAWLVAVATGGPAFDALAGQDEVAQTCLAPAPGTPVAADGSFLDALAVAEVIGEAEAEEDESEDAEQHGSDDGGPAAIAGWLVVDATEIVIDHAVVPAAPHVAVLAGRQVRTPGARGPPRA